MPRCKTAGWWKWKCRGIVNINVWEYEDLSMEDHTPDIWKITITAISHNDAKPKAEG